MKIFRVSPLSAPPVFSSTNSSPTLSNAARQASDPDWPAGVRRQRMGGRKDRKSTSVAEYYERPVSSPRVGNDARTWSSK